MTSGDFWVGISKKTRKIRHFLFGGGAFMGVWLSGENGQDTNLSNFALMYFEKGQIFKNLCRC